MPLGTRILAASAQITAKPLPYFCLTLAGRTPGRNSNSRRGAACCGPPVGRRPACATLWVARATPPSSPQSIGFGLSPIPPPEALRAWATRPATLKGRKSNAPFFQVRPRRPPHAPLMRRPRRGRRPKGRTSTAQSTPQFSAPCQPHCGSAFAPPLSPSPAAILGIGRAPTGRICPLRRAGAPKGRVAGSLYPILCFAHLRDSSIFGSPPK